MQKKADSSSFAQLCVHFVFLIYCSQLYLTGKHNGAFRGDQNWAEWGWVEIMVLMLCICCMETVLAQRNLNMEVHLIIVKGVSPPVRHLMVPAGIWLAMCVYHDWSPRFGVTLTSWSWVLVVCACVLWTKLWSSKTDESAVMQRQQCKVKLLCDSSSQQVDVLFVYMLVM